MKRAIISVSDKTDVSKLSNFLLKNGFEIYSTGGTYRIILNDAVNKGVPVGNLKKVEDLTGFPEILNGRVKTLHPHIYAGLLADQDNPDHLDEMHKLELESFDLVVCNLYPFIANPSIETIDIGGVTLLRAAAKNYSNVVVLSSPSQYDNFMKKYTVSSEEDIVLGTRETDRKGLAKAAFSFISGYDNAITKYLDENNEDEQLNLADICLKYGMNPHQDKTRVLFDDSSSKPFKIINGVMGMINIIDMIHGWLTVKEVDSILDLAAAISMKHTSLAGLAVGNYIDGVALSYYGLDPTDVDEITDVSVAYMKSRLGDPLSSFGDFICVSREVDLATAKLIKMEVTDGIAAPSFSDEALEILKTKKGGAFKIVQMNNDYYNDKIKNGWTELKKIFGITLEQNNNDHIEKFEDIKDMATRVDCVVAHTALKYAQSNNISMAINGQIIGMGCGQQNRVGCVKLAGDKALNWSLRNTEIARKFWNSTRGRGLKRQERVNLLYDYLDKEIKGMGDHNNYLTKYPVVLASDGFFPFTDNIEQAYKYGVKRIIHPGGSMKDDEIKAKCDELDIELNVTNKRMFYH